MTGLTKVAVSPMIVMTWIDVSSPKLPTLIKVQVERELATAAGADDTTTAAVLMAATFLPNADVAISSSRMAYRLRPKLERTRARTMRITRNTRVQRSVTPPIPPVTDFHSVSTVTASICKPSEGAPKYSPRTRKAVERGPVKSARTRTSL
jgi:hypothetical protein